jgi:hypothetical protein
MKTTDEHGTTVYFNIPDDAVVTASENEIVINLISHEPITPGHIVGKNSGVISFMRFGKASSTKHRTSNYFYLQDEEFAQLQKEVAQHFWLKEYTMKHQTPEDIYLGKIADLELALDASIMQCNALQEEVSQLREENQILLDAQKFADGVW